jgi:predicted nucleic acid-binding protein
MAERMVIDASVAAKWFLKDGVEQDVDLAEDILAALLAGDVELHAPRIFTYEVANLLAKACGARDPITRLPRKQQADALRDLEDLFSLPITIPAPTSDEAKSALEGAVRWSKTLYDMTYLLLAEELDCQWCTADDKILEALLATFPRQRVLLLSSLR